MGLVNTGIAVMSLLLVAFIFSFSGRQTQSGVPIEIKFPALPATPKPAPYTHPRAHEPREALVSRLLLEKKTTPHTTIHNTAPPL